MECYSNGLASASRPHVHAIAPHRPRCLNRARHEGRDATRAAGSCAVPDRASARDGGADPTHRLGERHREERRRRLPHRRRAGHARGGRGQRSTAGALERLHHRTGWAVPDSRAVWRIERVAGGVQTRPSAGRERRRRFRKRRTQHRHHDGQRLRSRRHRPRRGRPSSQRRCCNGAAKRQFAFRSARSAADRPRRSLRHARQRGQLATDVREGGLSAADRVAARRDRRDRNGGRNARAGGGDPRPCCADGRQRH